MSLSSACLFAACSKSDDDNDCNLGDCIAYCGGPTVVRAFCTCPEGLFFDGPPANCVARCSAGELVTTTACGGCPWLDVAPTAPPAQMIEVERCEAMMDVDTEAILCVEHCGSDVQVLGFDSCGENLVDTRSCPDVAVDGG